MKAGAGGDVRAMQQLLKEGKAGINNQIVCSGKTALMVKLPYRGSGMKLTFMRQVAIEAKQMAVVEFLLQNNADVNIPDDDQM